MGCGPSTASASPSSRARCSRCSGPTAPASPPPSGCSPRSRAPTRARREWPAPTSCASRTPCAGASASWPSGRPSTSRPPGARTWGCRARCTACAGAQRRHRVGELLDALRAGRGGGTGRPHLLGGHAAPARRRHGPGAPARGAVPGRAHHRARPRDPRAGCGTRSPGWRATTASPCSSPRTTSRRRTASPRGWPSSTEAAWWPRAARTRSSATCAATPSRWSWSRGGSTGT